MKKKKLTDEELVKEYVRLELEGNDKESRLKLGEEIAERDLLLEMEIALSIAQNRITQEEVDELLAKDTKTLIEKLESGKDAGVYNTIIRLILEEKRGVEVD